MRIFSIVALFSASIGLSSCGSSQATISANGRPAVLRYCQATSMEDPEASMDRFEPFARYMEKTLGVRVELTRTAGYAAVIEAFRADKIDAASISPFSYILATPNTPIEAIVMHGGKDGGASEYTGVLAVPGNSPIHSIEDLIHHSKELTISFVDPASASGFLVQNAYLQSMGIEPQKSFRKVVFSMNHVASLMTLKAGKIDVAATMEKLIKRYLESGKLAPGDVRIIWTSPPIPNQPIAVSKRLPAAFREEIRRAFIDMQRNDPKAFSAMMSTRMAAALGPQTAFVSANDAMFDGLRKMARGIPNLSLLEH